MTDEELKRLAEEFWENGWRGLPQKYQLLAGDVDALLRRVADQAEREERVRCERVVHEAWSVLLMRAPFVASELHAEILRRIKGGE